MTNESKASRQNVFGDGGTYVSHSKEMIQVSYLMALVSHTGLNMSDVIIDNDGIDVQIRGKCFSGPWKSPKIDLQLKCTSRSLIDAPNGVLKYDLDARTYNLLSAFSPYPQILVVNVIPVLQQEWLRQHDNGTTIVTTSYWYSLAGMESLSEGATTKRLYIPISQIFNSDALMKMMIMSSDTQDINNVEEVFL